jgi:hypothetical protein
MPKRRLIIGILALGIIAALIFTLTRPREPSYQGRSLSQWLEIASDKRDTPESKPAEEAIRQIGTNALRILMGWIQEEAPRWKGRLFYTVHEMFRKTGLPWRPDSQEGRDQKKAVTGFRVLGPRAEAAIPDLMELMSANGHPQREANAGLAMLYLGQEAVQTPSRLLTNQAISTPARASALSQLHELGTNAAPLVANIVQCLSDPNGGIRWLASNALRRIPPETLTNAPPR